MRERDRSRGCAEYHQAIEMTFAKTPHFNRETDPDFIIYILDEYFGLKLNAVITVPRAAYYLRSHGSHTNFIKRVRDREFVKNFVLTLIKRFKNN